MEYRWSLIRDDRGARTWRLNAANLLIGVSLRRSAGRHSDQAVRLSFDRSSSYLRDASTRAFSACLRILCPYGKSASARSIACARIHISGRPLPRFRTRLHRLLPSFFLPVFASDTQRRLRRTNWPAGSPSNGIITRVSRKRRGQKVRQPSKISVATIVL